MLTTLYLESEGSNATRHNPPAGDVLRQVAHAMDTVFGAQELALACLTDSVIGRLPIAGTSFLQLLLERQLNMKANLTS